jgi:hypothetical protein
VHPHDPRPCVMSSVRQDVDAKGEPTEKPFGLGRDMGPSPPIADVRERLLHRVLISATAMLVVRRHGRVVVPRSMRRCRYMSASSNARRRSDSAPAVSAGSGIPSAHGWVVPGTPGTPPGRGRRG